MATRKSRSSGGSRRSSSRSAGNSGSRRSPATTGSRRGETASGRASNSRSSGRRSSGRATAGRQNKITTDHEEIRRWAEERGAVPARLKGTGGKGDPGLIRLDFPGFSGEGSLDHISWEEWFDAFENNRLALVYQEKTAGGRKSNFNKLVSREELEQPRAKAA